MIIGGASDRTRRRAAMALVVVLALGGCSLGGASDGTAGNADDRTSGGSSTGPIPCSEVDPTSWTAFQTDADLVSIVGAGEAPHPLEAGATTGPPTIATLYPMAEDFLAQSNVPDPAARLEVMEAAGFSAGIETEYAGERPSKIQVLDFRDSAAVADYLVARIPNICAQGGARTVTVLADGDGISWVDPLGATHGEFILGSKQVSLILCECGDARALATMQTWHDAWIEGYSSQTSSSES